MAIKTRYRIKNSRGEYEIVHFQTSADQIITDENFQFVTLEEKEQIAKPKHYVHNQIASTDVWKINHNLGKFPSVSIVDSAGTVVIGDVSHTDINNLTISFASGFAGTAYLN